jgi:hypothetical protein
MPAHRRCGHGHGAGVRKPSKNETAGKWRLGRTTSYGDFVGVEDVAGGLGDARWRREGTLMGRKAAPLDPPDCISIYGLPMMCRWAEGVPAHIIYAPVSL